VSRKHPTQEELEKKAEHIAAERAKVSNFRPYIKHENPDNPYEPGKVERDRQGLILGEMRPVARLFQTPYSVLLPWLKATHDQRGPCSRPNCAFRNMTADEEVTVRAIEDKTPDLVTV
jgi:hypothetical protein